MAESTIYTAHATKEERWWIVRVDGVGVTQAKNLREAQLMARDLVEAMTGNPSSHFDVAIRAE
jgi:hypothetical protein